MPLFRLKISLKHAPFEQVEGKGRRRVSQESPKKIEVNLRLFLLKFLAGLSYKNGIWTLINDRRTLYHLSTVFAYKTFSKNYVTEQ